MSLTQHVKKCEEANAPPHVATLWTW